MKYPIGRHKRQSTQQPNQQPQTGREDPVPFCRLFVFGHCAHQVVAHLRHAPIRGEGVNHQRQAAERGKAKGQAVALSLPGLGFGRHHVATQLAKTTKIHRAPTPSRPQRQESSPPIMRSPNRTRNIPNRYITVVDFTGTSGSSRPGSLQARRLLVAKQRSTHFASRTDLVGSAQNVLHTKRGKRPLPSTGHRFLR